MKDLLFLAQAEAPATQAQTQVPAPGAPEQAPAPSMTDGLMQMLPFIAIFVLLMWFMSRSQKKQALKRQEALNQIIKGDKVVTTSGIYGVITEVKYESFILEIAPNVKIEITKNGVTSALPKDDTAVETAK